MSCRRYATLYAIVCIPNGMLFIDGFFFFTNLLSLTGYDFNIFEKIYIFSTTKLTTPATPNEENIVIARHKVPKQSRKLSKL